jgi:CRP-like cAMP-binding protein
MRSFKKGSVFYTPGETGEVLFIIKKGAVQLFKKSPEGRKFVIGRLPAYTFFGEMRSVGQKMYDTFAEVTEDSLICTLRRPEVKRLLLSKPRVALRLLEAVSSRAHELEQQLAELAFEGLIPRVASLLLQEAEGDEVKGLSHQDIADRLGVYRETATNALKELRKAGLINIRRRRITILDRDGLTKLARP